jgi:hypothetical protein
MIPAHQLHFLVYNTDHRVTILYRDRVVTSKKTQELSALCFIIKVHQVIYANQGNSLKYTLVATKQNKYILW